MRQNGVCVSGDELATSPGSHPAPQWDRVQHTLQENHLPITPDPAAPPYLHHSSTSADTLFTPPLGHYNTIMYPMNIYRGTFT